MIGIRDGSGSVTFQVPGGLEGVLASMPLGYGNDVSKDSKITIAGADLNASKTDVRPNETITITGSGFGVQTCIPGVQHHAGQRSGHGPPRLPGGSLR